jgi:hypothetical protein
VSWRSGVIGSLRRTARVLLVSASRDTIRPEHPPSPVIGDTILKTSSFNGGRGNLENEAFDL